MKTTRKALFVLVSSGLICLLTSCHRGTGHSGCPVWGKAKTEQVAGKRV